jgi:hypothetical protein
VVALLNTRYTFATNHLISKLSLFLCLGFFVGEVQSV